MNLTYEQIIDSMKASYFAECNHSATTDENLIVRLNSVATELYALSVYGDYILKQAFPFSATGDYLDKYALQVGLQRKAKSKAAGQLTFSTEQVATQDVIIPAKTICSVYGKPFIQFETVESATIFAGSSSATVSAVSVDETKEHNAAPNTVTVMVNPPTGVNSVTNLEGFSGGSSDESDEELRARIMRSFSVPLNGVNAKSLAGVIEKNDDVLCCNIACGTVAGVINVYLKTRSVEISNELKNEIENSLGICKLAGCTLNINLASEKQVKVVCDAIVFSGADKDLVKSKITEILTKAFSAENIGEKISVSDLAIKLSGIDYVKSISVHSPNASADQISCSDNEYLVLNEAQVNVDE